MSTTQQPKCWGILGDHQNGGHRRGDSQQDCSARDVTVGPSMGIPREEEPGNLTISDYLAAKLKDS